MLTCEVFFWAPPIKHIKFQNNHCIYNVKLKVVSERDRTTVSLLREELPFQQKSPVLQVIQILSLAEASFTDKDNLTNLIIPGKNKTVTRDLLY